MARTSTILCSLRVWQTLLLLGAVTFMSIPQANALNLVLSNDDGWASANIRAFYKALKAAGHNVLISAPATNQSGKGGSLTDPEPLGDDGGEFDSIPAGAPAEGQDPDDPNIWYVNATPASSVRFALENLTSQAFGGNPDLVLTGPNHGNNLGLEFHFSGTLGAALYAVNASLPAIAFSGANDTQRSYTTIGDDDDSANVYAALATQFVQKITAGGSPFMNQKNGINVNFPQVSSSCSSSSSFKFIQTRVLDTPAHNDFCTCGQSSDCLLPTESHVLGEDDGCKSSVSVFDQEFLTPDADSDGEGAVNGKLGDLLSCD